MQTPLPIDSQLPAAIGLLTKHSSLVLKAPPGAGKTTRLPAALLDSKILGSKGEVWVLEPRRIAARMAAMRVARERGVRLGEEVGYRVRFENETSPSTRLCFVTEGVLVRRLQGDPELAGVSAVVCDEFHERNLEADLSLAFLREIQQTIRPDLRLVVMSATLDPGAIASYLGDCPVLISEGRAFPIEIEHARAGRDEPLEQRTAGALARLLEGGLDGSVLVFVPGAAEIRRALRALEPLAARHGFGLVPLHGDLPPEAQDAAVAGARRRIVVSTNLAEASITVEGIEAVIDSGLVRVARFDPHRGLNRLVTERISKSSAVQRAGRAGRLGPGRCLRLYSESDFAAMEEADEPEIRRVDLSEALLQILAWGSRDPRAFAWMTPPDPAVLERGIQLLRKLGAVQGDPPRLTAVGAEMRELPAHPRQARILVDARRRGCFPEAAILAALAGERDIRIQGRAFSDPAAARREEIHAASDLLALGESLEAAERLRFDPIQCAAIGIDARAARRCAKVAGHLGRLGGPSARRHPAPLPWSDRLERDLLVCVAAGYPDRVIRRRLSPQQGSEEQREGLMVGGMGTRLDPSSSVSREDLYVAIDAVPERDARGRFVRVRLASGVRIEWLRELFPGEIRTVDAIRFDEEAERVTGTRLTLLDDLPLEEKILGAVDSEAAADVLYEAACRHPERAIEGTRDLEDLLARLRWLSERRPELELPAPPTPSGSVVRPGGSNAAPVAASTADPILLAALFPLCPGRRSFAELRRAPLLESVHNLLAWETRRALESEVPARIALPSGRSARLVYRPREAPLLAARIQEFFGCDRTPAVAGGLVPVVLQLLAPSQRPVQVTSDLASFWRNVYPKLRLELRRRYPRHSWPEDPLAATPGGKPRSRSD